MVRLPGVVKRSPCKEPMACAHRIGDRRCPCVCSNDLAQRVTSRRPYLYWDSRSSLAMPICGALNEQKA
jgi:hypothetical protein